MGVTHASGLWFLVLLDLKYRFHPPGFVLSARAFSTTGACPSSSDPFGKFACPIIPVVLSRSVSSCSPARSEALAGHVPIYLGVRHRPSGQQGLRDEQKCVSTSKEHRWAGPRLLMCTQHSSLNKWQLPLVCPAQTLPFLCTQNES